MTADRQLKDRLYLEYHGQILSYFQSRLSDPHVAEDLCGDVFLKVCEKLDSFDESKASFSTWIYTLSRNRLTDYYRTRHISSEIPENLASDESIEDALCSAEALETLADALERLPERERDIIVLHYYSGMTLREISAKMCISYSYTKALHSKALSLMKNFF